MRAAFPSIALAGWALLCVLLPVVRVPAGEGAPPAQVTEPGNVAALAVLPKMMQLTSKLWTRLDLSRFHIVANDKCIACNECSRNCQVGIDVMQYALKQETLDNATSSCIGCGICVTVCPMDTLSYSTDGKGSSAVVQGG